MMLKRSWNMLDDFFGVRTRGDVLKTDIKEEENNYLFTVEVPGVSKENIDLEVKEGNLIITVEKSFEDEDKDDKYLRQEIEYGSYSRTFHIGDIAIEDISAKCSNGILTITVPKQPKKENKKQIEINWQ